MHVDIMMYVPKYSTILIAGTYSVLGWIFVYVYGPRPSNWTRLSLRVTLCIVMYYVWPPTLQLHSQITLKEKPDGHITCAAVFRTPPS